MTKQVETLALINKPYLHQHLDVSTAHITLNDSKLLAIDAAGETGDGLVVYDYGYGWMVHVEDEAIERCRDDYSDAFKAILVMARQLKCDFVDFDQDGEEYSELPVFDW